MSYIIQNTQEALTQKPGKIYPAPAAPPAPAPVMPPILRPGVLTTDTLLALGILKENR